MNRRKFLKFLGEVVAVTGIAAGVGLPEKVQHDPNLTKRLLEAIQPTEVYNGGTVPIASNLSTKKLAKWKGEAWD